MKRFDVPATLRSACLLAGTGLFLAACSTSDTDKVLDVGQGQGTQGQVADARPTGEELRRFCPTVQLREGTAYFNTYAKGLENDPSGVVYQAAIADVTRSCQ